MHPIQFFASKKNSRPTLRTTQRSGVSACMETEKMNINSTFASEDAIEESTTTPCEKPVHVRVSSVSVCVCAQIHDSYACIGCEYET